MRISTFSLAHKKPHKMKQQKPVSTSQLITLAQQHIHNWKQIYRGRRGTRVKQDDVSTILFSFMFSLPDLDGSGWAHISAHPCNYFTNLARSTHSSLGRWVRGLKKKKSVFSDPESGGPATKSTLLCCVSNSPVPILRLLDQSNVYPVCHRDKLELFKSSSLSQLEKVLTPLPFQVMVWSFCIESILSTFAPHD